ncbi:MAG TPA: biotin--[acetyl-CoA-carboxylase] ligase [Thermoleophilaceae bacterium]|nr:biotin--[acetyl-CoA-carboxylase] ligase [Thermoleophilaceae bacterium]
MIGSPRVHHRVTDSTNERAKELAAAGAPHGTLVTADEQTAGRGRQGREWTAPPRSAVLMSVVLRELDERHALLPLAAALAVCDACECEGSVMAGCQVKWPNDVWINGRKVAGILIEGRPQQGWAVVGVGLNVWMDTEDFPPELRETATSLLIEEGAPPIEQMLSGIVDHLDEWLGAPPAGVLEAWRSRDALKGQPVRWTGGEGVASGIDDSGALVVETSTGLVSLDAGEVHLLR